ncbi:serine hydrolase domain-containing protein [Sphingomonas sp. HF-S4]|uniref:Serine hydrolase domain-containing protein n=1 Tax=Sphingomonas agrestis TaxID=3080540 RepID=A0ABU3Y266_9SPHN|nr:serine hydrolase domain-containing protein [Sphingomonas sp. HF-S4]MDV3455469.1 serine hydrolase domain-containing protein [Sphingomonas sp. HF-S4]
MRILWTMIAAMLVAGAAPAASAQEDAIDAAVKAAMTRTGVKGLALAVIEDGKPVSVRSYGVRNPADAPLETDTVMYGASLTKTLFAYTVMQLVDEGRIDLDKPIAAMLPKPLPDYGNLDAYGNWGDLAADPRWRTITPRMVLTHSTGFANFAFDEPDGKLRIHFDPGSRYAYSGEGIILLQFGIEKGLGLDLGAEMQRRVFDRFGMKTTSMKWRADFARNMADGWTLEGAVEPHDERSRVRAAGSMDTTIADMARFAAGLIRGDGLRTGSLRELIRGQLPITTASQFPSLQPEAPVAARPKGVAAGLGVIAFAGPQGAGFFKGGHNDSTANTLVCVAQRRRCVVILSNDVRAEAAFPELVRVAIGETGVPWHWEYPRLFGKR